MAVASSGIEVPIATIVNPMTISGTPSISAIVVAADTVNLLPMATANAPAMN